MRFTFTEKDPSIVRDKIMQALGGRELGKIVDFSLEGNRLEVTISKLGTSKLSFEQKKVTSGLEFNLASQKIALTHRAFQDEVKKKICQVIEQVGGKIVEA